MTRDHRTFTAFARHEPCVCLDLGIPRPGAASHHRSGLHFDHLLEAAKDHALAVEGHRGIAGCGRVHAWVFHHRLRR
jgi:hypothetical protein